MPTDVERGFVRKKKEQKIVLSRKSSPSTRYLCPSQAIGAMLHRVGQPQVWPTMEPETNINELNSFRLADDFFA